MSNDSKNISNHSKNISKPPAKEDDLEIFDLTFKSNNTRMKKRTRAEETKKISKKSKLWPLKDKELGLILEKKLEGIIQQAKESNIEELDCIDNIKVELTSRFDNFFKVLKQIKISKQEEINSKIQQAQSEYIQKLRTLGIKISQCGICLEELPASNMVQIPCNHNLCMPCYKPIQYYTDDGKISFKCPSCRKIHTTSIPSKSTLENSYYNEISDSLDYYTADRFSVQYYEEHEEHHELIHDNNTSQDYSPLSP